MPEETRSQSRMEQCEFHTVLGAYHEHPAPLGVVECRLHHEQLHCLRGVTGQELDQGLSEWTSSL
jgi:hypothetical protein